MYWNTLSLGDNIAHNADMKPLQTLRVHIYPLSRLVYASPADWERQLKDIEDGKVNAFKYYYPLREAVVLYCKSKGKRHEEALQCLETKARLITAHRRADPVRDNRDAFNSFVAHFYPRIVAFKKSLLKDDHDECQFGAVRIDGTPHFIATDASGADRYVFLLPSRWEENDTKAYLELLAYIISERYGAPSQSLWCMDLRSGMDFRWKSSSRVRNQCEKTASHYARLVKAISAS